MESSPTVYLQQCEGKRRWLNVECSVAAHGFKSLGYRIRPFQSQDAYRGKVEVSPTTPVVGEDRLVLRMLRSLGRISPDRLVYPHALRRLMDRDPSYMYLRELQSITSSGKLLYPLFVKPVREYDVFSSRVVGTAEDFIPLSLLPPETQVYKTPALSITSLSRFYMLDSTCVGVCHLQGDPRIFPSAKFMDKLFRYARDMLQIAYSLDVAVVYFKDRPERIQYPSTLLGAKDVFTMGSRGLLPETYALMLSKRWEQLQTISR